MKRFVLLLLLFPAALIAKAQDLVLNYSVDTLEPDVKKAIYFFQSYLSEFRQDSAFIAGITPAYKLPEFRRYWSEQDCRRYLIPDQMVYAINSEYPTYLMAGSRTVISIKPQSDYVHIKTVFGSVDSNDFYPLGITNHYVSVKEGQSPQFINPLDINLRTWQSTIIRNITYHYPSYHRFDSAQANKLIESVIQLEKDWNLLPVPITYYFADTRGEIDKLRGFDYTITMTNRDRPSGISDDTDNLIYCAGLSENYFHEVVHIYLNRLFPNSPLKEGLAAFYGGSMGKDFTWHIKRVKDHLAAHPEINLDELDSFTYLDNYTNPISTIQALFCSITYEKEGIKGLKRLMSYATLDDIYEKEFRKGEKDKNTLIRELIAKQ